MKLNIEESRIIEKYILLKLNFIFFYLFSTQKLGDGSG